MSVCAVLTCYMIMYWSGDLMEFMIVWHAVFCKMLVYMCVFINSWLAGFCEGSESGPTMCTFLYLSCVCFISGIHWTPYQHFKIKHLSQLSSIVRSVSVLWETFLTARMRNDVGKLVKFLYFWIILDSLLLLWAEKVKGRAACLKKIYKSPCQS